MRPKSCCRVATPNWGCLMAAKAVPDPQGVVTSAADAAMTVGARQAAMIMAVSAAAKTKSRAAADLISTMIWTTKFRSEGSEEHTSELQSLMRISYAVFCLKKKRTHTTQNTKKA